MTEREHPRMPYAVQVEFRTPSSFLITYSVNLSRGGLFLETDQEIPEGSPIGLMLVIPNVGQIEIAGTVMWRRPPESPDGPAGLGIEFADVAPQLGFVIDRLVSTFHGMQILLLSGDRQDRTTLARSIKSIITTAEILQAADASVAGTLMTNEIDLAVVDVEFDVDGALNTLRAAKQVVPPVPTVALVSNPKLREHAKAAGADELVANPPPFAELQVVLIRALAKPVAVK